MTQDWVSIAPTAEKILADLARENMTWAKALSEPIDNSLDANAKRILVQVDRQARTVRIVDNGDGCPEPHKMLSEGYSTKRGKRNVLGRYGVGLKHASYYLCGEKGTTTITTMARGKCLAVSAIWREVVEREWRIAPPEESDASLFSDGSGTEIRFEGVCKQFLTQAQLASVLADLSFTFSPALRSGRQIEISEKRGKRTLLVAPREPVWLEPPIEFEVTEIPNRRARVRAGIKSPDDKSGRRGLSYCYCHRVIIADSARACGTYSVNDVAGFVELDAGWVLGQNKSEVTDEHMGALDGLILERLRPLLEKASSATRQLQSESLRAEISDTLRRVLSDGSVGQAKRPGRHGEKREKERDIDRKVEQAKVIDGPGSVKGRRGTRGPVVDFYTDAADARSGYVDQDSGRIWLNDAVESVARAKTDNDRSRLVLIAGAHYIAWLASRPRQLKFVGEQVSFDLLMGRFLAKSADLVPVAAEALAR